MYNSLVRTGALAAAITVLVSALALYLVPAVIWTPTPRQIEEGELVGGVLTDERYLRIEPRVLWSVQSLPYEVGRNLVMSLVDNVLFVAPGGDTTFVKYDISGGKWEELSELPARLSVGASMAFADGRLYLLTGDGGEFFAYDIEGDNWVPLEPMPGDADTGSCIVWGGDGYLYAIASGNLFKYNIEHGWWAKVTTLSVPNGRGTCAVYVDGWIYYTRGDETKRFAKVSVDTGNNVELARLPVSVSTGASLVYDGRYIYATSGRPAPMALMRYDIEYDGWVTLARLPDLGVSDYSHGNHSFMIGDLLYVVCETGDILTYDLSSGDYSVSVPVAPAKSFYGSTIASGENRVFGMMAYSTGYDVEFLFPAFFNMSTVRENVAIARLSGGRAEIFLSFKRSIVPTTERLYRLTFARVGDDYVMFADNTTHLFVSSQAYGDVTWEVVGDLPVRMPDFGSTSAWLGGDIYYTRADTPDDNLYVYSIASGTWRTLPGIGAGVRVCALETSGDLVYAWADTGALYSFNPRENKWELADDSLVGFIGEPVDMVSAGDTIYLLASGTTRNFYAYSRDSGVTRLANVRSRVYADGGALVWNGDDKVFAATGGGTNILWEYSVDANRWLVVHSLPFGMFRGASLAWARNDYG